MSFNNSLSNFDIIKILKDMNIEINGVFSRDDLPDKLKIGFYVVNLDDSTHSGTHWTSFYYNPVYSIYFDAFGFISSAEVQNKIKPYIYCDVDIQDIDSSACGYYCIAFIKFLYGKHDKYKYFEAFLNLFSSDTKKNDRILHNILYNY